MADGSLYSALKANSKHPRTAGCSQPPSAKAEGLGARIQGVEGPSPFLAVIAVVINLFRYKFRFYIRYHYMKQPNDPKHDNRYGALPSISYERPAKS